MNNEIVNVNNNIIKKNKILKQKNRRVNIVDLKFVVFNKKRKQQIAFLNRRSTLNFRNVSIFFNNNLVNNHFYRYKTKFVENKNNKTFVHKLVFIFSNTNLRRRFDRFDFF